MDWLERCQKIQIGMSYDDVVKTLGIPEALSQGNAGEDVMMMYKPPYPGFKTNPTSALVVSEFLVDIKDGKVTYYTLGYE
ncbi:MAG: hypothetical protein PHW08_06965 [Kiritimatiellae bacterium]|nr:hypothetical protein [Kiritimatiellia bacterium]